MISYTIIPKGYKGHVFCNRIHQECGIAYYTLGTSRLCYRCATLYDYRLYDDVDNNAIHISNLMN